MGEPREPDLGQLEHQLTRAAAASEERTGLVRRLAAADRRVAAARAVAAGTLERLPAGSTDVPPLEAQSLPRLLASLRGSGATQLDRDRAERKRAEYSHAVATAGLDYAIADRQQLREALHATSDAPDKQLTALRAQLAHLETSTPAHDLARLAGRRGELLAEQAETRHALTAGREARAALTQARRQLSSVDSWDRVDVFNHGGFLADSSQRSRMDQAARLLHAAEMALHRFGHQLAELGTTVEVLQLHLTMIVLDAVFDSIFADDTRSFEIAALHRNSRAPAHRADEADEALTRAVAALEARLTELAAEHRALEDQRLGLAAP
jgi:hypothetical protein